MPEGDSFRTNSDLFSNHYLDDHLPETEDWTRVPDEEIEQALDQIREVFENKRDYLEGYNEDRLQRRFINPILDILGFAYAIEETVSRGQRRPDYGFFADEAALEDADDRRDAGEDFYANAIAVGDAKRWDRALDTRGERRHDFENPSHQIHVYLQDTPAGWAILTNGRKWRLYHESTSHRLDSYYEIDLPAVIESGDLETFRYFYLFFRKAAFVEDATGASFLDDVYEGSNIFAQDLGEDLQDNIYEAIKLLAEGFLEYPDNDLSRDDLDLIHDSALIYLYRVIFVLYAESEGRDLLDTDNRIYKESYSLNLLKQEVAEKLDRADPPFHNWEDDLWSHLQDLFELIDQGSRSKGIPEDELHVPAYNGGLFRTDPDAMDSEEARFLAEHPVGDAYMARVIDLLTRSQNGANGGKTFVDYSSLDIRHLGSVYEGLLEYKLRVADEPLTLDDGEYVPADDGDVAVEPGEVYLTTDSGERKATGSYYTPEYIVEYIVENTLGPLVKEIRAELFEEAMGRDDPGFAEEFAERVFELKVLDPAMGSGHFLTNAVDFLAREIIHAQERQAEQQGAESIDQSHDIYWARRQVAQRCIYGVDLNPLAVELAKVSLWLRTLAAEQPLAFLDHHLKTGNSLVGSDIEEVLAENGANGDAGQLTLRDSFDRTRQEAIEHVMERFQDLLAIDNETLDDIKTMEDVYQEVREDELYQHLIAMANVHTAEDFGLDVPEDAYEQMARALRDDAWDEIEDEPWFEDAQGMAEEERFFHWELEFPVAFYDPDGTRKTEGGFDSVIGNPPYVRMEQIKPLKPFLSSRYSVHDERVDLYGYFIERSVELSGGKYGVIVSNKWMKSEYGRGIRALLSSQTIESILDFGDLEVFEGISTYPCILIVDTRDRAVDETLVVQIQDLEFSDLRNVVRQRSYTVPADSFDEGKWSLGTRNEERLLSAIQETSTPLRDHDLTSDTDIQDGVGRGIVTGGNDAFIIDGQTRNDIIQSDPESGQLIRPILKGKDISRYHITSRDRYLIYAYHGIDIEQYPGVKAHLEKFKDQIGSTATSEEWYELQQPQEEYEDHFESQKICYPDIAEECSFAMDVEGRYLANTCYFIPSESYALLGVLNSNPMDWFYQYVTSEYRGGYQRSFTHAIKDLPIPDGLNSGPEAKELAGLAQEAMNLRTRRADLNLSLLDHLGSYAEGNQLTDVGLSQPSPGAADSPVSATTEDLENLRVGIAEVRRESPTAIEIYLTARYKPGGEGGHETDQWGYTETEPLPAIRITELSERQADLIQAFVPVAVEEGDGFAGFRENATKNISPLDRLKAITLPDPDAVANDLERYLETKRRAEGLDEKIEKTDALIDEIVYELYGLDEAEVEIVEGAVGED